MLAHNVFFSLKDASPDNAQALVHSCHKHLAGHEGETYFAAGTRATYDREVNDKEFDVFLIIVFESHETHDAYQVSNRHNQFIAENAIHWAKVRVFDADLS